MVQVGVIIMMYMVEGLTASLPWGPGLPICISKFIYVDDMVWQLEEKIETTTYSHTHQHRVLIVSKEKKGKESFRDVREMELNKV